MSNTSLYICLECGSLGSRDNLMFDETLSVPGPLSVILQTNSFGRYVCPKCGKWENIVFQRHETANRTSPLSIKPIIRDVPAGTPWVPVEPTVAIGEDFTNISIAEQPPAEVAATPFRGDDPARVAPKFSSTCDICKEQFQSKVDGATRCKACLAKTVKNMM